MLTSSANPYLRSDYLSPVQGINIELDAKKSPLALLAQTCSQIGSDGPTKNSSASEKGTNKEKLSPGDKSPSLSVSGTEDLSKNSTSFKPYEKKKDDIDDRSGTPSHKRNTPGGRSPLGISHDTPRSTSRNSDGGKTPINVHDLPSISSAEGNSTKRRSSSPKSSSAGHSLSSLGDLSKDPLAAYKLAPSLYSPLGVGLEHLGAAGLSALTAKVSNASGPSSCSSSTLTNPYIGYARVKTPGGTELIIPVCRDPYCTGCQINTHALQVVNGTCPQGCAQCVQAAAHTKTLSSLPSSLISSLPSSLSSLYPPPGLIGGSHHPYVCNWIAGDSYCGKRFTSSEELLQHLRGHTSSAESSLTLPPLHPHPLLSAALPRGYPTPPLSPLSAARFHPYAKTPLSHLTPASPLSSAAASALSVASLSALSPHPLSAYYNPYSIYSRSLGATVPGLHP